MNLLEHTEQAKGFSPVCVLWCTVCSPNVLNLLGQKQQANTRAMLNVAPDYEEEKKKKFLKNLPKKREEARKN